MSETLQTILSLALVLAALGFLLWRGLRRRGSECDGSDCGCGKGTLKKPRH